MKVTAIVLAAGKGSRMQSEIKKQYMLLNGKPVIWYALDAFQRSSVDEIILVTSLGEEAYCQEIVKKSGFTKVVNIVHGGKERYESVYAGLCATKNSSYVLIHDGARPLISIPVIEKCVDRVKENKACIVAVPVKDTIKIIDKEGNVAETPERNGLRVVQTPQAFPYVLIREAYAKMFNDENVKVTDDSMVIELYTGEKVGIIEGEYTNIKITTKEDIEIAEKFLKKSQKSVDRKNVW